MDRDLLALEVRGLPDPLPDRSHLRGFLFRGNLQEGRRLEPPDVGVRVERIEMVKVQTERGHVDLLFVRWLIEGSEQTTIHAFSSFTAGLNWECCWSRAMIGSCVV